LFLCIIKFVCSRSKKKVIVIIVVAVIIVIVIIEVAVIIVIVIIEVAVIIVIFVGYNTNGYRIWDPNTVKTYVSRDVTFTNKPVIPNKQQEMERVIDPVTFPDEQHTK
jgi:hypothetical protein